MSIKPGDDKAVPLCHDHHLRIHAMGSEAAFAWIHGIDLDQIAALEWAASVAKGLYRPRR
jgi:hypothetical protein